MTAPRPLGWFGIARLGLVQAALGSIVVLTTSLLNRVMVIELHLAASVPGALVGLHYALQMLRPRWGHGSDGARRTPWIVGGMLVLASGGALAAFATATMASRFTLGLSMAIAAFVLIGIGVGASGTALLTLLADRVAPARKAAAASVVWIMMIAGFVVTSAVAAHVIAPFSYAAVVRLSVAVSVVAVVVTIAAVAGLEGTPPVARPEAKPPFGEALAQVWVEPEARSFAAFIFVSMLAYSAQDLILEPFAGLAFALPAAATTAITSLQNGGVLVGMIAVALFGRFVGGGTTRAMRLTTLAGCLMSGFALGLIALAGIDRMEWLIRPAIAALGFSNGVFAVSAIGLMMALAENGDGAGVRMGVWGAAQAIAFGGGGFLGTVAVDSARVLTGAAVPAYALVFTVEGAIFVLAAAMMTERNAQSRVALATGELGERM